MQSGSSSSSSADWVAYYAAAVATAVALAQGWAWLLTRRTRIRVQTGSAYELATGVRSLDIEVTNLSWHPIKVAEAGWWGANGKRLSIASSLFKPAGIPSVIGPRDQWHGWVDFDDYVPRLLDPEKIVAWVELPARKRPYKSRRRRVDP